MMVSTDSLCLAVQDADAAAHTFRRLFDAVIVGDASDRAAGARRLTLQWGESLLELLQPDGPGSVEAFMSRRGIGAFAGGFAAADPEALVRELRERGLAPIARDDGRWLLPPERFDGIGVLIGPIEPRRRAGLVGRLYQITWAVPELDRALARHAGALGLADRTVHHHRRVRYNYEQALVRLDASGRSPDNIELVASIGGGNTVASFVARNGGPGTFSASVESDAADEIERRIAAAGGWSPRSAPGGGGLVSPRVLHGLNLYVLPRAPDPSQ
ncbi:MAG: hypothetical protein AB7Q97_16485 [Gammaproteobacteria bacterium]